jgi:hypothetical protein
MLAYVISPNSRKQTVKHEGGAASPAEEHAPELAIKFWLPSNAIQSACAHDSAVGDGIKRKNHQGFEETFAPRSRSDPVAESERWLGR